MHIGSREPFVVMFEPESAFHQYLCMFDQEGVIKAMMVHMHAKQCTGEKQLKDEFDRLRKIEAGELYRQRVAW